MFVIPGFLLTQIFFKDSDVLEKILSTVLMSIMFTTAISLMLGFNEFTYNITGGLKNIWAYVLIGNILLLLAYVGKEKYFNHRHIDVQHGKEKRESSKRKNT
ncbi:MAG: hypothetical protein NDI94_06665, partial [Candidatus Woesearchaeota archaeon]|nr:hypothetical protein [Candidatus Woesearchaeota archaeon]